jgi:hypothetical protein
MFDLFYHQAMHLFEMFGQQPFDTIRDNVNANFTLPFQPNLHPFLSFRAILGGQGGDDG